MLRVEERRGIRHTERKQRERGWVRGSIETLSNDETRWNEITKMESREGGAMGMKIERVVDGDEMRGAVG